MEFPFKAVAFDWAHTLVDLGEEDDRPPLEKVFTFLSLHFVTFLRFLQINIKIFLIATEYLKKIWFFSENLF